MKKRNNSLKSIESVDVKASAATQPAITIDQWRALMAVVDAGGYAQAARALAKSQSSVTYAVQKLESLLRVKAFQIEGRKARLTPTGELLYRRAHALVNEALEMERAARRLSAGWEAEIGLAVEVLFPTWLLLRSLARFAQESPHTRIELYETVIGGTAEALAEGRAALAIAPRTPKGYLGEALIRMAVVPAASPDHPLFKLGRPLTLRDLRAHRHLVVRDSGSQRTRATAIVDIEQRWTVTDMSTSIQAARMGYGFAWYPEEKIREELASGALKRLPLRGGELFAEMYLVHADGDTAGPGTLRLAQIIVEDVKSSCAGADHRR